MIREFIGTKIPKYRGRKAMKWVQQLAFSDFPPTGMKSDPNKEAE